MSITFETDLQKLVPAYMRESDRFLVFLEEVGKILDELKGKIDSLSEWNVDEISIDYVQHVADRLGYLLQRSGAGLTYSETELRRLLKAIPTLYRLKGTDQGFEAVVWYYYGVSIIAILELWTKDYAEFKPYLSPGDPQLVNGGEWYVSPHVMFTFPLTIFETLGALVSGGEQEGRRVFNEILSRLNDFRPAHCVFHWALEHPTLNVGTVTAAPWSTNCIRTNFAASRAWL